MTALLEEPRSPAIGTQTPAQNLRAGMAAVRVSFTWLGTRKSLSAEQRDEAAQPFDADGGSLSAGKKILDTKHSAFKVLTAVKTKIASTWKSLSLPYPEPGVRLIRRDQINEFVSLMEAYRGELADAVINLDRHYGELKATAAERLGRLYNPCDYPETLLGLFDVSWDFPSVEPPDYLRDLNPALYEAERARVAARFDEAVQMAETAFQEEFAKLVGHLTERISGSGEDGERKVFRDRRVGNLQEFFGRFRSLNVGSSAQLDELVAQAQQAVRGVAAKDLRGSQDLRQRVVADLSRVQVALDGMLVNRPRRRIAHHEGGFMNLIIGPNGLIRGIYSEDIALDALGSPRITRASHVEPDAQGRWLADLAPVGGPVLGPFQRRSDALDAEVAWLEAHWLVDSRHIPTGEGA